MKQKELLLKFGALLLTAGVTLAPVTTLQAAVTNTSATNSVSAGSAATSSGSAKSTSGTLTSGSAKSASADTARENDLKNQDIIDTTRKGSLTIHKYDITAAEAAGDYKSGTYEATGETDTRVETALKDYEIQGVGFSLLKTGEVETHSITDSKGSSVEIVYEISTELAGILKLSKNDAVNMSGKNEANPCTKAGVYHYTSQQINQALQTILSNDNTASKTALENYIKRSANVISMEKTDQQGITSVDGLSVGLYLVVETEVPENVTATVNPWFVSIPFTNSTGTAGTGGEKWLYDMTCYPKNQTGNPTLDKSVRQKAAEGSSADDYEDTATASEGDILEYILLSHLPHISSQTTWLSEYTFHDTLSKGLTYQRDAQIAFYKSAEDANANNLSKAACIWKSADGYFEQKYEASGTQKKDTCMTVTMTAKGLSVINSSYSDYYMVVYYTAALNSDAEVVLGDNGNPNDVTLVWSRSSDGYYNVLEDRNYVYSYGLDLTKQFSDGNGDFSKVHFRLYNSNDCGYITAEKTEDGLYYVTGMTAEEAKATEFVPNSSDGTLLIKGMEADTYQLTETATDSGYKLLADEITIQITPTDRDIIASSAGVTGMDKAAMEKIILNYNNGIVNENGDYVNSAVDELNGKTVPGAAEETANGNDIGKTDLYVGSIISASASVDGQKAVMKSENSSVNASVALSITNQKGFLLPQTGGDGMNPATILGVITAAGGFGMISVSGKKRSKKNA